MKSLNDYKWIISSGCSYGRMIDSISNPIRTTIYQQLNNDVPPQHIITEDTILLNFSVSSQGVNWQSDSIIYVSNFLLNNGVCQDNIYCFVEWSQWSRIHIPLYKSTLGLQLSDFDKNNFNKLKNDFSFYLFEDSNLEYSEISELPTQYHLIKQIINNLDIGTLSSCQSIGYIEDMVYLSPTHTNSSFLNSNEEVKKFWMDEAVKLSYEIPYEIRIKNLFDSILKTQWFFESKNIKYNFIQMQSNFNGWYFDNGVIKHNIENNTDTYTKYKLLSNTKIQYNEKWNPINDSSKDIENIFNEYKFLFNLIDFSKWWFYENNKFRRGGIDEWCIDNFNECGYVGTNNKTHDIENFDFEFSPPTFNEHPNQILYCMLWNEVSKDCNFFKMNKDFIDWLYDKFLEDYNSDEKTVNWITISKKYFIEHCT
jgi:hypothetical protein